MELDRIEVFVNKFEVFIRLSNKLNFIILFSFIEGEKIRM